MVRINGKEYVWKESTTISDLLKESDHYNSCYLVELNNEYIFKPDFDAIFVPENSTIVTISIIAGG